MRRGDPFRPKPGKGIYVDFGGKKPEVVSRDEWETKVREEDPEMELPVDFTEKMTDEEFYRAIQDRERVYRIVADMEQIVKHELTVRYGVQQFSEMGVVKRNISALNPLPGNDEDVLRLLLTPPRAEWVEKPEHFLALLTVTRERGILPGAADMEMALVDMTKKSAKDPLTDIGFLQFLYSSVHSAMNFIVLHGSAEQRQKLEDTMGKEGADTVAALSDQQKFQLLTDASAAEIATNPGFYSLLLAAVAEKGLIPRGAEFTSVFDPAVQDSIHDSLPIVRHWIEQLFEKEEKKVVQSNINLLEWEFAELTHRECIELLYDERPEEIALNPTRYKALLNIAYQKGYLLPDLRGLLSKEERQSVSKSKEFAAGLRAEMRVLKEEVFERKMRVLDSGSDLEKKEISDYAVRELLSSGGFSKYTNPELIQVILEEHSKPADQQNLPILLALLEECEERYML